MRKILFIFFLVPIFIYGQESVTYNEKPNKDVEIIKITKNGIDLNTPYMTWWNDTLWLYAEGKRFIFEDYMVGECIHQWQLTEYCIKKPSDDSEKEAKFKLYEEADKNNLFRLRICSKCGVLSMDPEEIHKKNNQ